MSKRITKPKTATNWKGEQEEIHWPKKGHIVAKCGEVYMIQHNRDSFQIVYGLEVKPPMDYATAASQFGYSVMHQSSCDGLLNP